MKTVNVEQMQSLDRQTMEEHGVAGEVLMARAGAGVARLVSRRLELRGAGEGIVLMVAGKGNNGGDVFAAATDLFDLGYSPVVWLAAEEDEIKGDALVHLERMRAAGVPLIEKSSPEQWESAPAEFLHVAMLVEGLLGTGTRGAPREPIASAIRAVNEIGQRAQVVSIDIPSGLNGDTGEAAGDAVVADLTVTMALPKTGLLKPAALPYVGSVEVVDIGVPAELVDRLPEADVNFVDREDVRAVLPRRPHEAHKGRYGHVLLIAGAAHYSGAATMAARAAVRSGAGLVSVLTTRAVAPIVAAACPEAMVTGGAETEEGTLAYTAWETMKERMGEFSAILCGPGLTQEDDSARIVSDLIRNSTVPLVLDADALNVLKGKPEVLKQATQPVLLTPHPGELARLMGTTVTEIQQDRYASVRRAGHTTGCTVLLKGAGTLVADGDAPLRVNLTGNPGMASGGSGDVLAGLVTGFVGQGLTCADAASAAAYVHGRAGDIGALIFSQTALCAGAVINCLASALQEILPR